MFIVQRKELNKKTNLRGKGIYLYCSIEEKVLILPSSVDMKLSVNVDGQKSFLKAGHVIVQNCSNSKATLSDLKNIHVKPT